MKLGPHNPFGNPFVRGHSQPKAQLSISTPNASATSPAWIEGTNGGDVSHVAVSVNAGAAFDATLLSPTTWFADNSSAGGTSLGVALSPIAATAVEFVAFNSFGDSNSTAQNITWTATDLAGRSYSSDILRIRKGDSLLLTANGAGAALTIDADGNGTYELSGAPGQAFPTAYTTAGTFVAKAKIDGTEVGSLTVVVVSVNLDGPIACEVGFQREKGVDILDGQNSDVAFSSNDAHLMTVSVKAPTAYGARLYLKAQRRGTPILLARLNTEPGSLIAMQEVDEFTLETPALLELLVNAETGVGTTTLTMRPYISDLTILASMFAHSSTFAGGATNLSVNTNTIAQVFDPETGETMGELTFDIESPSAETMYCFSLKVDQFSTHGTDASETHTVNGSECKFTVDRSVRFEGDSAAVAMKVTADEQNVNNHGYRKPHTFTIEGCPATGVPDKYDCDVATTYSWDPKISLNGTTAGEYEVKIDKTSFGKKLLVVRVTFTPDPLDNIITGRSAPLAVTVLPAGVPVVFDTEDHAVATVSGTAPTLTVTAVSAAATRVLAKVYDMQVQSVAVSGIDNAVFPPASATVAAGAAPSQALGAGVYGLTFPENVTAVITAGRDGDQWFPIVTGVAGNYSQQMRLLPGQTEVTGPAAGGNTTAANAARQVACLNSLGNLVGCDWYMLAAVQAHEDVHATRFQPAIREATVTPVLEGAIEALHVGTTGTNRAAAIVALRALPDFNTALVNANANWLTRILVRVANDHNAGGACETAEHGVVDPMVVAIHAVFP